MCFFKDGSRILVPGKNDPFGIAHDQIEDRVSYSFPGRIKDLGTDTQDLLLVVHRKTDVGMAVKELTVRLDHRGQLDLQVGELLKLLVAIDTKTALALNNPIECFNDIA